MQTWPAQPGADDPSGPSSGTAIQFQLLAIVGGALFWCGLAFPAVRDGTSLLAGTDVKPRVLLAVVLVPLLVGVVVGPHRRFFAGLAGGVAAWAGAGLAVFWLDSIRLATTGPVDAHAKLAAGAFCQIGATAVLIMAAVASAALVPDDEPVTNGWIWAAGTLGAAVVGIGVIVPPVSMPFKSWWQLTEPTGWAGGGFLFFVCVMFIVAAVGFRHGPWGLGLVAGFFVEAFVAHQASSGELFTAYAHDAFGYSSVATVGFVVVVLTVAVMAILLAAPDTFAPLLPAPDDPAGGVDRPARFHGPAPLPTHPPSLDVAAPLAPANWNVPTSPPPAAAGSATHSWPAPTPPTPGT